MAYDLGLAVCGVVPDLGNCLDRQGVTMLGMFILAVAGALPCWPRFRASDSSRASRGGPAAHSRAAHARGKTGSGAPRQGSGLAAHS